VTKFVDQVHEWRVCDKTKVTLGSECNQQRPIVRTS
jgi:hypothetical protein